ncbi:MAG: hypothetical protein HW386_1513 [Gammaproteobacteria bacterium]|nr:hypothetical protein [Gammaproteobacteria bacterium]
MNDITINWKEYFDNGCKGEDMWGHYTTANGDLYVVADGASNHEYTKTGADVVRFVHDVLRESAADIKRTEELKKILYAINTISSKINKGAYAAIAGILVRGTTVFSFSAGDVAIIGKKANGQLIQVLPLDLNMGRAEAETLARAEIGSVVNDIEITKENVEQRINQYMHHGLSNAIGIGDTFFLHEKRFNVKDRSAVLIATDGITDPFMAPQKEAGKIPEPGAPKLYEIMNSSHNAQEAVDSLAAMIWDTQVKEKIRIKPDDRTGLFIYMDSPENEYITWIAGLFD